MPLDGMLIRKLSLELDNELRGGKIDSVDGLNKTDFLLKVRSHSKNYFLYISVSYNNPTIFMTLEKFEKPLVATGFTMFLRKYLEGALIRGIRQYNNDRVIMIDIESQSDLYGSQKRTICLELIGRFSNFLLLDEEERIIDAVKQLSVLENESRGVMRGLKYDPLKNEKIAYTDRDSFDKIFNNYENRIETELVKNVSGVSPLLAKYILTEYAKSDKEFYDFFIETIDKYEPTLKGNDYYFFNIFNGDNERFDTISELLYEYYKRNAEAKILKDNNQEIYKCVQSNVKRLKKKIVKLNEDMDKDLNSDIYRLKGELLLSYQYSLKSRDSKVTVLNYYTNEEMVIDIDPRYSIKDNAQNYYKKYRKSKNAIEHIERELEIAKSELEYFNLLDFQLTKASLKDLQEIKEELISGMYLKNKERNPKKKKLKPNYLVINFNECKILVGKNNLQNDYITHKLSSKDDLWFHVKDSHGSHVVVSGENKYSEEVIRKAALLAATYSEAKDSSSVPVDYTEIKNLRKVPGTKGSFVTFKRNKTIYIDPKRED